jgi:NAD(P)-dependent dehydrogenase (short-subunit alcohol dehydrogenase family)
MAGNPEQPVVLITGSNRGLGLALAGGYARAGWRVIATCRRPDEARELADLARAHPGVRVEALDVASDASVAALAVRHHGKPIDVLLNNAGVYGTLARQTLGSMDFSEAMRVIDINALGGLRVSQALIENVAASGQKKIVSLGGGLGVQSIGSTFGGHYFMKMSKAAHLMAMGVLQTDVKDKGIRIVMISPGRVDTQLMRDSGYTGPALSPEESARLVIVRIANLDEKMRGRLVTCEGQIIPW